MKVKNKIIFKPHPEDYTGDKLLVVMQVNKKTHKGLLFRQKGCYYFINFGTLKKIGIDREMILSITKEWAVNKDEPFHFCLKRNGYNPASWWIRLSHTALVKMNIFGEPIDDYVPFIPRTLYNVL